MEKNTLLSHEVVMASSDKTTNNFIAKMKKEGRLVKIAPKIYTTNLNDTPENIILRNLFFILGELYPNAVMSHRSAFECRPTSDGHIFLTYLYTKKVSLPGITIHLLEPFRTTIHSWDCTCQAVQGPILRIFRPPIAGTEFPNVYQEMLLKKNWIKSFR